MYTLDCINDSNTMKSNNKNKNNNKYHTVKTIPKSNIKVVERGQIYTSNTQIHDRLLFWLNTDTPIQYGLVKY